MEHRCRYAGTDGNITAVIPDRAIQAKRHIAVVGHPEADRSGGAPVRVKTSLTGQARRPQGQVSRAGGRQHLITAKPALTETSSVRLQELTGRGIRIVVPDHGHDIIGVNYGPPGLALELDQAVRADFHAGQLLVLGHRKRNRPDPATSMEIDPDLPMRGSSKARIVSPVINRHLQVSLRSTTPYPGP